MRIRVGSAIAAIVSLASCSPALAAQSPAAPAAQAASPFDQVTAFHAAFGGPEPASHAVRSSDGSIASAEFKPEGMVELGSGVLALVSAGTVAGACHPCSGALAVHYLRRSPTGFEVLGEWFDLAEVGEFGAAPEWKLRTDLFDYPALLATFEGGGQGCFVDGGDLIELTPQGPITRAHNVVLGSSNAAMLPTHIVEQRGSILPREKGQAFVVRYTGTHSEDVRWARMEGNDEFQPSSRKSPNACG